MPNIDTIYRHRAPIYSYDNFLRVLNYDHIMHKFDYIQNKYAPKPKRVIELKYDIIIRNYSYELNYSESTYHTLTKPLIRKIKLFDLVDDINCETSDNC